MELNVWIHWYFGISEDGTRGGRFDGGWHYWFFASFMQIEMLVFKTSGGLTIFSSFIVCTSLGILFPIISSSLTLRPTSKVGAKNDVSRIFIDFASIYFISSNNSHLVLWS